MKISWASLRRRLAGLRELRRPGQWWLFARVFCFAAAVPLLFSLKFGVITRWLERRTRVSSKSAVDLAKVEPIIRCVELARVIGGPLVCPRCLTRGVTLYFFLRRAGLPVSLCFGDAMKKGDIVQMVGHCWLVKDGEPFLENNDPRPQFRLVYSLPESAHLPGGSTGAI
jgi:hypothetical protein